MWRSDTNTDTNTDTNADADTNANADVCPLNRLIIAKSAKKLS